MASLGTCIAHTLDSTISYPLSAVHVTIRVSSGMGSSPSATFDFDRYLQVQAQNLHPSLLSFRGVSRYMVGLSDPVGDNTNRGHLS